MEVLLFLFGVISGFVISGFVVMSKMYNSIKSLKQELSNTKTQLKSVISDISRDEKLIHKRIDGEIDRVNGFVSTLSNQISVLDTNIHRLMDSRLDKLESKLMDTIMYDELSNKNGCDPVKEKKVL